MLKQKIFYILLIIYSFSQSILGQELIKIYPNGKSSKIDSVFIEAMVENGDTALLINLETITVMPPYVFSSPREERRYSRLVLYVKKVYPYSKIVAEQVNEIHANLSLYGTKREKNEYIEKKEAELKQEFEGQLRKLTYTQGRILIKLIDRETGTTTYELVKELKGSLNAFFWQSVARLFGSNLKLEYDAQGDDRMIEDIVVKIENGQL